MGSVVVVPVIDDDTNEDDGTDGGGGGADENIDGVADILADGKLLVSIGLN